MKIKIKNSIYTNEKKSQVDVELCHPVYGWIPYTFHYETEDESFDSVIREYLDKDETEIKAFNKVNLEISY